VADPWDIIALYESRDTIDRLFQTRHGLSLSTTRAHEIGSHFSQGREYFRSAERASLLVRPLLLYYGVIALSRGLILFLDPTMSEDTLPGAHGLESVGWKHVLAKGPGHIGELEVQVTKGTFNELLRATQNRERAVVQVGGSSVLSWPGRWTRALRAARVGTFTYFDQLSRLPDLVDMRERMQLEPPRMLRVDLWLGTPDRVYVEPGNNFLLELRVNRHHTV
jgi:hypothetical protein